MSSLTCRIELNKQGGIIITVRGADGSVVQTAKLDGKCITLSCQDGSDTSTIVQAPDAITVRCKRFEVDAESVSLRSSKDTSCQCGGKLVARSQGDLELDSSAALNVKAATELALSASSVSSDAKEQATFTGGLTKLAAREQLSAVAPRLELRGDLEVELTAATAIKVATDGKLDLEGTLATLRGQLTEVKGTLVKLG